MKLRPVLFIRAAAFLSTVLSAVLAPAPALAGQQLPAFYYGVVTVVGPAGSVPAPAGSVISAKVGSSNVTPTMVSVGMGGRYGGPSGADDKLLVQDTADYSLSTGDRIDFYDNGVKANESSAFQSGSIHQLDLTVNDGDGPVAPANLKNTSAPNVNLPSFTWDASTDLLSGVSAYGVRIDGGQWQWLGNVTAWTSGSTLKDGVHTLEVEAKDGVGNTGKPSSLSFNIDSSLPAIMNPTVAALQKNSAIITWSSNKPALSWLDYGVSAAYSWTKDGATSPATSHAVTLTGLLESTTYHYRIRIRDSLGNEAATKDLFFTTLAPPGPGSTPLANDTAAPTVPPATTVTVTAPAIVGATQIVTTTPPPTRVMDANGVMLMSRTLDSADNNAHLDISQGVRALDASGKPLGQVSAVPLPVPPPFHTGVLLMAYDFQPPGATFSPPVKMSMNYEPAAIPQGYTEGKLRIAYWDEATSDWVLLPSMIDAQSHTVSALVSRFAPYALVLADERTSTAPAAANSFIDRLIEKAIIAAASLLAFIAALVALIIILRMRRRRAG